MDPQLWGFTFELQDFAQNVSHVTSKTYFTHDHFSDRSVYVALTGETERRRDWAFRRVPATLALPTGEVQKHRTWFVTVPRDFQRSNKRVQASRVLLDGYKELIMPGTLYEGFAFVNPPHNLFIGKKGAFARIIDAQPVDYTLSERRWTTTDLVYVGELARLREEGILQRLRISDASARYLVGEFECSRLLETAYHGERRAFLSLYLWLTEQMAKAEGR